MSTFTSVPIGGLEARVADELIPFGSALEAADCYVDDDEVSGRNGYRSVMPQGMRIGAQGAMLQGMWRFRPSASAAWTVVVADGAVYLVSDPSSETESDATVTSLGNVFGPASIISGAQSGRYFYLYSDQSPTAACRLTPAGTLEALGSLSAPQDVTYTLSAMTKVVYGSPVTTDCVVTRTWGGKTYTDYWFVKSTSGGRPPQGSALRFDLGSVQDWSTYSWIACFVSPRRVWDSGGRADRPTVQIDISADAVSWKTIGQVRDGRPVTAAGAGPAVVYLPLSVLHGDDLAAVRYVRYTLVNAGELWGSQGCYWGVGSHSLISTVSGSGTTYYRFTVRNSVSGVRSSMSDPTPDGVPVTLTALGQNDIPKHHGFGMDKWPGGNEGFRDFGMLSVDYTSLPKDYVANYGMEIALPQRDKWGLIPTLTCQLPADSRYPLADVVELWRMTQNGWRLAGTKTLTGGETTASITDAGGDIVLSAEEYQPFGSQPRANAAASRSGARLVVGLSNILSISSFIPAGPTADPQPSWPPSATQSSHGWSFDIAPSAAEQIVSVVDGDYMYVLSNRGVHAMMDVIPDSPFYRVSSHGCISRRGAIWTEVGLVFASWDGAYVLQGRSEASEFTKSIRRLYRSWLNPDGSTVLCYQSRKLYIICGNRYLRFDIVSGVWTRGSLSHSVVDAAFWSDPGSSMPEQMWLLLSNGQIGRWQSSASSDMMYGQVEGTPIPDWRYSTGMVFDPVKTKVDRLLVDASGPVRVSISRSATGNPERSRAIAPGSGGAPIEIAAWGDTSSYQWRIEVQGRNSVRMRRIQWARSGLSAVGGEKR